MSIKKITIRDQDVEDADVGTELKDLPELTLWDWYEKEPYKDYHQSVKEHGGMLAEKDDEVEIELIGNFGDFEFDLLEWTKNNPDLCSRKFYESKGFTNIDAAKHQSLPGEIGYNERNVGEYCWGIKGDSDAQLKEIIGGRKAFDTMELQMDNSLIRLLIYMPGNCIPLHLDNYVNWGETFEHLNPKINRSPGIIEALKDPEFDRFTLHERSTCDLGKVGRRLVTISEWKVGQMIMLENTFFPKWNAGDVYNIPANIYHMSANMGLTLKISMIVTGVEDK